MGARRRFQLQGNRSRKCQLPRLPSTAMARITPPIPSTSHIHISVQSIINSWPRSQRLPTTKPPNSPSPPLPPRKPHAYPNPQAPHPLVPIHRLKPARRPSRDHHRERYHSATRSHAQDIHHLRDAAAVIQLLSDLGVSCHLPRRVPRPCRVQCGV